MGTGIGESEKKVLGDCTQPRRRHAVKGWGGRMIKFGGN